LSAEEKKDFTGDPEVEQFLDAISREDNLGAIIRGHLHVESKLIQLIESALPEPGAIDLGRLQFPTKLELAVALGLITEDEKRGLAALNSLRNKLAHNVHYELVEMDQRQLFNALPKTVREALKEGFAKDLVFPSGLRICIMNFHSMLNARLDQYLSEHPVPEQAKPKTDGSSDNPKATGNDKKPS
jgi:hypothetical protein